MVPVHEKIQELLTWKDWSQYRLADVMGIPKGSIGSYVSGRTPISLELLEKFAAALEVSPWVLINGASLPADTEDLTEAEGQLVADLRHFSQDQQEIVLETVRVIKRQNNRRGK